MRWGTIFAESLRTVQPERCHGGIGKHYGDSLRITKADAAIACAKSMPSSRSRQYSDCCCRMQRLEAGWKYRSLCGMRTLILKLNATGDVVRTTSLLRRLEGEVAWITAPTNVPLLDGVDRKSTRLNSSHVKISYAVFCLKKKNTTI